MASADGGPHEVLDVRGGVGWATGADGKEGEGSIGGRLGQLLLDRVPGDIGDRDPAPAGLVAQASVEVLGEHNGRALHAYSLAHSTPNWYPHGSA